MTFTLQPLLAQELMEDQKVPSTKALPKKPKTVPLHEVLQRGVSARHHHVISALTDHETMELKNGDDALQWTRTKDENGNLIRLETTVRFKWG